MRRLSVLFWALACVTLLAVGCDDDEPGGSTTDTGTDTTDTSGDLSDDIPSGDTAQETGPDQSPEDTADQTTDPEPDIPVGPLVCRPSDCEAPQACVGGACVDPVDDLGQYADEAAGRPSSYFWSIQLPALYPEVERCCFDYNGDAQRRPDDGLGSLLALVANLPQVNFDIQGTLDATIEDGTITLITDWRELPATSGDVRFSILLGSNDLDEDGEPDDPFADVDGECTTGTRCGGDGTYALDPISFGTHGSQVQFNVGSLENGVLRAGPSTFQLTISIEALGSEPLLLTLQDAQIEAPITVQANGVRTVDQLRNAGTDDEFFAGGGKLGGVIDASEILGLLDEQFRLCTCAGIDPTQPVLAWELNELQGALDVYCTANTGDEVNECDGNPTDPEDPDDGPLCGQISTICGFASFIGGVLDVDRDNDGINESLSAGLRFAWAGAAIDGLIGTEDVE
jgi:hypothetical protein